ncbi:MAG: peptidylprolyl isomerase [Ignavibacteria bacterium]|nr:peptidylprolyl isomerase [Ignavibacteria bacterium]
MAMMAKMRDLAPAFIITVGVLFVLFMVISDSNVLEAFGGRTNNIASINGTDISYQDFMAYIDRARENQKAQTGQDVDEENMEQFRDQVWDAVITQTLTEQTLKKLGITVSDEEIRDVILGENPPEFLKRNFIDSTGNFNREFFEQALFDPRNKEALLQAEEAVRQSLLSQKLEHTLYATINVSEAEIKQRFIDQNIKMTADWVIVDVNSIADSTVDFTDSELSKYYKENPDKFTIDAQRKLKYLNFKLAPSRKDSNAVLQNLQNVMERLKSDTSDFKSYVDIYSETPYSRDTVSIEALPVSVEIVNASSGKIIGPVTTPQGYGIYKLIGTSPSTEVLVKASHVLIQSTGDDAKDLAEANQIYDELTKGANFATIAKQKSKDPGSAANGGDLGWFAKGRMVKEFEDACFNGPVSVVQKPVKTTYGYHIIKVVDKINKKFVVEKITNSVKYSATTRDEIFNQATDFSFLAAKNGFEKEAELGKYQVNESTPFNKDVYAVPGIGYNKGLVEFAFDNGLNTVSSVYKTTNGYTVVLVSEIINAGVKPFEEVKTEVENLVKREKKFEKASVIAKNIKAKVGSNLSKAKDVYAFARYDTSANFTTAGSVPKLGVEYSVSSAAYEQKLNSISDPVRGLRGYYLIRTLSRNEFDNNTFTMQRNSLRDNLYQEKKSSYYQQWIANLKETANIRDNRHLFFGR